MRAIVFVLALLAWTGAALAQPIPPPTQEPPQGEPDAAAEPPAPVSPTVRINPNAPTDAYDSRVRQSFAAAESFQGPLDGGWTLSATDGSTFDLRFTDHGGKVEAVWRDPKRVGALDATGFVDVDAHSASDVQLHFRPRRSDVITLY